MTQIKLFFGTLLFTILPAILIAFFVRRVLKKYGFEFRYSSLVAVAFAVFFFVFLQWISR